MKKPLEELRAAHLDSKAEWELIYRKFVELGDVAHAMFALQMAKRHEEWAKEETTV